MNPKVSVIFVVLHVHPLLLVLPSVLDLLLPLPHFVPDLSHCLLYFLVEELAVVALVLRALVVLLEVVLAGGPLAELEGAVGEHVDRLHLVAGVLVQLLEDLPRTPELLHLHQVLPQRGQRLRLVLLPLLAHPLVQLQQQHFRGLEVVLPHQVVGALQPHVDAVGVRLLAALHRLQALPLRLALLQQVRQADLCDARVGLRDITLDLRLGGGGLEGVGEALLGGFDAAFEGLDGLDALVDVCELHEALVVASGDVVDVALEDLLGLLLLLGDLKQVGVAHHQHFVLRALGVGQPVKVLRLLVVKRFVLLLRELEELLEGEVCERLHRHQQPIYNNPAPTLQHSQAAYARIMQPEAQSGFKLFVEMPTSFKRFIILLALLSFCPTVESNNSISPNAIFGVRWFLGEKFRFQEPIPEGDAETPSCHLMLIFNSQLPWSTHSFSVEMANTDFACVTTRAVQEVTSDHHEQYNQFASKIGDTFTTYLHKCPVTFPSNHLLEQVSTLAYTIRAQEEDKKQILLEAKLRSPVYGSGELSMAVLGDWGLMTAFSKQYRLSRPITDCLRTQIEQRQDLRLLLLLGDLAYDLQGQNYVEFLSYLSAFSSQIVLMLTPGNHETVRHQDIFLLFKESFYSPCWNRFYGYFDLVSIRNHLFLGYNPEHLFPWMARTSHSSLFQITLKEEFHNFTNMFSLQFPPSTRTAIRQMTLISFSHYPTYCSKKDDYEDCNKYRELHSALTGELQDLGVDLFLAGHVHMYERTKQLCDGERKIQGGVQRDGVYEFWIEKGCSVFVIEGAAGNNYFVEAAHNIQLRHFSEKFAGNTGFGILTLNSTVFNDVHFVHLSIDEGCWPVDEFILHTHGLASEAATSTTIWVVGTIICVALTVLVVMRRKLYEQFMRLIHRKQSIAHDIELVEDEGIHR